MKIVLFAGGPTENVPPIETLKEKYAGAVWIGVDRGAFTLLKAGITPKQAFGDFDSLTKSEKDWVHEQHVHLSIYPEEKDATDMELALDWALSQNPQQIILLGGTGGRLDHLFINIQFLQKGWEYGVEIILEDRWNRLTVQEPGEYSIEESEYQYVSFLPLTMSVEGLTLKGFRYPLVNCTLSQGSSLCISNELVDKEGNYTFSSGKIIVMETMDKRDTPAI